MKLLELQNLYYSAQDTDILAGIDLTIFSGEFLTIIGPSGSGKSTLLRMLNHLSSPTKGEILYKEKNINTYAPESIRTEISYIFQKPYLFGNTVMDNLTYPFILHKQAPNHDQIHSLLKELNMDVSILRKNIHSLSGGEQQRISLIRSLLLAPEILLLDEITASLDPINRTLVEEFIKYLYQKNNLTILMVTHDMQQARKMGKRTIYIKQGKICYDLPTQSFFEQKIDEELDRFKNEQI